MSRHAKTGTRPAGNGGDQRAVDDCGLRRVARDGKAVFARREDTMKHGPAALSRHTAAYGPDTVTAAETVASLASTLDRTLFLPGSDVPESKIKPAIFGAGDHVD